MRNLKDLWVRCRLSFALLVAALALTLGACGTTKIVKVAVPVTCEADLPEEPAFAFDSLAPGSNIWVQTATLLADRRQRIDYERQLRAAKAVCP